MNCAMRGFYTLKPLAYGANNICVQSVDNIEFTLAKYVGKDIEHRKGFIHL